MIRIALDAGHGLYTPGRRCLKKYDPNETREWQLNKKVAEYVEKELQDYDIEILRVDDRTGETDISLKERTGKANTWGANMFISIHHNAGVNGGSGGGVTVHRYPNSGKFTKQMQKKLYDSIVKYNGLKGNRVGPLYEDNFYVLRNTNMPAVLIENGFMDSSTDIPIIITNTHAKNTAKGIAEFIVDHFKIEKMEEDKNQEVSSWAKEAWEWAIRAGITDGTNPKGNVTREMLVTMLYRIRG